MDPAAERRSTAPPPSDPLAWVQDSLGELESAGLLRHRRVRSGLPEGSIDFGSNDYLGLAGDPRLAEAAAESAERHGWGAGASPVVSGRTEAHAALEERLARFEHAEAALTFPAGFAANAGVIPALVGPGDVVYSDAANHASLIDGCRLASAERRVYPHADAATLGAMLDKDRGRFRRRLIVTDGLFSMDGDFAPLAELSRLAADHDAMLLIDEAHATGVWGPTGRGAVEHLLSVDTPPGLIRIGTLSKALGSAGGFVVGSASLINWLANRARSYVFSTAPPAALAAAAIAALDLVDVEPQRRQRVLRSAAWLRQRLTEAGWDTRPSESQIVPIVVGEPNAAMRLAGRLAERGLFVPAIRPPSVPVGRSLLRVSVTASHTEEELARLVETLGDAPAASSPTARASQPS